MEWLLYADRSLFLLINSRPSHSLLDPVMRFFSDPPLVIAVLLISLSLFLLIRKGRPGYKTILFLVLSVAITDPVSARVFKPWIQRHRPNHPEFSVESGRFIKGMNGSPSYPSSHAANIFGAAAVLTCLWPAGTALWFGVAVLVGYSRIYLGQHFPLDVFGGAALGICIGGGVVWAENTWSRWRSRKKSNAC